MEPFVTQLEMKLGSSSITQLSALLGFKWTVPWWVGGVLVHFDPLFSATWGPFCINLEVVLPPIPSVIIV